MGDNLKFKGVNNIGDVGFSNQLSHNIISFLDWAFLGIGGFSNINVSPSGYTGPDQSRLRRVNDPYSTFGCVYETFRSNWVYESGVPYGISPNTYSGVYINNQFYDKDTTGTYSHKVNYPLGRITFDTPLSEYSLVQCSYSFKQIKVTSSEVPWSRTLMFDSLQINNPQFLQQGSGVWNILSQNRVQLPVVVIDPTTEVNFSPLEMGGGQYRNQSVMLYVFAEHPSERNNIMDILLNQSEKSILFYDLNSVIADNKFPLDFNGGIRDDGYLYPDLINNYAKWKCTILRSDVIDIFEDRDIYRAAVKWLCEVPLCNI
jgi:hypothetical protein